MLMTSSNVIMLLLSRSAFDLTQHSNATGIKLTAEKRLPALVTRVTTEIVPNKGALVKAFKKEAKEVMEMLAKLSLDQIEKVETELSEASQKTDGFLYYLGACLC